MTEVANEIQIGGNHYKTSGYQVWDFIDIYNIPFLEGNFIKYVVRHRKKNGIKDLQKAQHYLIKIAERDEEKIEIDCTILVEDLSKNYDLNSNETLVIHSLLTGQYQVTEEKLVKLMISLNEANK